MRNKNVLRTIGAMGMTLCLSLVLMFVTAGRAYADDSALEIPTENYSAWIDDAADLLNDAEEEALCNVMLPITAYGHAAFLTTDFNPGTSESYNWNFYDAYFGTDPGIIFLIDMDNRLLQISADGILYEYVGENYADSITDNVYRFAADGDYSACAQEVFRQINMILEGERIAQPMKYITNALLALVISVGIMFLLVLLSIRKKAVSRDEMLKYIDYHCSINGMTKIHTTSMKLASSSGGSYHSSGGSYHSSSGGSSFRSSGGSSHHSSGGSHHSSGGSSHHSGGGGSHRF